MSIRVSKKQRVDLKSNTVVVCVGPGNEEYNVHEGLLTTHSPFFKAALGKDWKEGETRRVSLPEDEPDIFEIYASWLYHRKICSIAEKNDADSFSHEVNQLMRAYVLGEKLQDIDFRDAVIDALMSRKASLTDLKRSFYPGDSCVRIIYNGTTESSPARQLVVDFYACFCREDQLAKTSDLPAEFFRDLASALIAGKNKKMEDPKDRVDKCHYHAHNKGGTPCYKTWVNP